jgi:hypothetical protein
MNIIEIPRKSVGLSLNLYCAYHGHVDCIASKMKVQFWRQLQGKKVEGPPFPPGVV